MIEGNLKLVRTTQEGKVIEIIGDYKKIKDYLEMARNCEVSRDKKEHIYEINYGKRGKYQPNEKIYEMNNYRKGLLSRKIDRGLIPKVTLELKNSAQHLDSWSREKGFKNYEEYLNIIALGRGFTCYREYEKVWKYYPGMTSPVKENRKMAKFLGVHIAENAVVKLFEGAQRMPYNNIGYDIICPKGYKMDVKATVLSRYNIFNFHISRNMIADYFILVAFNNIIELEPLHLWIIGGNEAGLRDLNMLCIRNESDHLSKYQKYEKIDKMEKLRSICEIFNTKNGVNVEDYNVPNKNLILDIISQLRSEGKSDILPTDILHVIEKKKKETITARVPIIPAEDCRTGRC